MEDAIRALVQRGTPESLVLEYKERYPKEAEKKGTNKEIAKDISAFANGAGGQVIIGVAEDKKRKGFPAGAPGVEAAGEEAQRIEDVATGAISPKIGPLRVLPVAKKGDASRGFVIVSVPQSISAPHMVVADKDYRYYTRRNLKSEPMREDEVRLLYETRYRALERVDDFLDSLKRLVWPGGIDAVHSENQVAVELVCCPILTRDDRVNPAEPACFKWAEEFADRFRLHYVIDISPFARASAEGIRLDWPDNMYRRGQILRNGALRLETTLKSIEGEREELTPRYIFGDKVVKLFRFFVENAGKVMQMAEYFGEVRLRFRIMGERKLYLVRSGEWPDNEDKKPWHTWSEPEPLTEIATTFELTNIPDGPARRLADHLWNCFGWRRCYYWDESGNWVGGE